MSQPGFQLSFTVRDYECDLQGVVNNSVYMNYLEHARHEFLMANNVDFAALAAEGINLMVMRAEIDYKASLVPHDQFHVTCRMIRDGRIKVAFLQEVIREDGKVMVKARTIGAGVQNGRPMRDLSMFDHFVETE